MDTSPGLSPAENGKHDIAAQLQAVAIDSHFAAIGISGLWVVEGSAGCVRGVTETEAAANIEITERPAAKRPIGVVDVKNGVRSRTNQQNPDAETAGARFDANDGSGRLLPVAQHWRCLCLQWRIAGEDCKQHDGLKPTDRVGHC